MQKMQEQFSAKSSPRYQFQLSPIPEVSIEISGYEPDRTNRTQLSYPGEGRWFIARMACMQKMQEQFSA
ncbi:MAG: hypothetical protein E2O62_05010 [Gammaproteobacteria bacterium]|nr:MAG: hypothetical protein E2O62_05010 [Gammaproteobacteria bacterium]